MDKEISIVKWQGYEIEISFCGSWSAAMVEHYGVHLCHFEIRTRSPERAALPITSTGYQSIFIPEPELADFASPTAYIIAMLDHVAQSPEWQSTLENARQYSLFD